VGCVQMDRADWILAERRRLAARYAEALSKVDWIETPSTPRGFEHGYQAYVCLFRPEHPTLANVDSLHRRRNELMAHLEREGIATRQGTHAAALVEYYASRYRLTPDDFPRAWIADRLTLALPLYPQMTEAEQDEVCRSLSAAYAVESR